MYISASGRHEREDSAMARGCPFRLCIPRSASMLLAALREVVIHVASTTGEDNYVG